MSSEITPEPLSRWTLTEALGQVYSVIAMTSLWVQGSVSVAFALLCTIPAETQTHLACDSIHYMVEMVWQGNPFITMKRAWQGIHSYSREVVVWEPFITVEGYGRAW